MQYSFYQNYNIDLAYTRQEHKFDCPKKLMMLHHEANDLTLLMWHNTNVTLSSLTLSFIGITIGMNTNITICCFVKNMLVEQNLTVNYC